MLQERRLADALLLASWRSRLWRRRGEILRESGAETTFLGVVRAIITNELDQLVQTGDLNRREETWPFYLYGNQAKIPATLRGRTAPGEREARPDRRLAMLHVRRQRRQDCQFLDRNKKRKHCRIARFGRKSHGLREGRFEPEPGPDASVRIIRDRRSWTCSRDCQKLAARARSPLATKYCGRKMIRQGCCWIGCIARRRTPDHVQPSFAVTDVRRRRRSGIVPAQPADGACRTPGRPTAILERWTYYANADTGETRWDPPPQPVAQPAQAFTRAAPAPAPMPFATQPAADPYAQAQPFSPQPQTFSPQPTQAFSPQPTTAVPMPVRTAPVQPTPAPAPMPMPITQAPSVPMPTHVRQNSVPNLAPPAPAWL